MKFLLHNSFLFVIFFFVILVCVFYRPVFLQGKIPIPADTLVGLYYPFRDIYSTTNPNGVPYKNFLITDPIRQQIPWKYIAVEQWKKGEVPLWNPYTFSGTPLLANLQGGVFYPFTLYFFVLPFLPAWTLYIVSQTLLLLLFMYWYLRSLGLRIISSVFGSVAWTFSGFSVSWLLWGNIVHTLLWLPLIFLSLDRIMTNTKKRVPLLWLSVLALSLLSSFFAGHLQTFFYCVVITFFYGMFRILTVTEKNDRARTLLFLGITLSLVFVVSLIQLKPTLQFISESARNIDQASYTQEGWFIPYNQLMQFVIPDFFGNPSTLNYTGVWNYGEMIGFIGVLGLFMSFIGVTLFKKPVIRFFCFVVLVCLLFATPNVIAFLPFQFHIPFISTSQPTRLISMIDFALAVLSAFGIDYLLRAFTEKTIPKRVIVVTIGWIAFFIVTFLYVQKEHMAVAKNNLYLPGIFFVLLLGSMVCLRFIRVKYIGFFVGIILILISSVDGIRFAEKYNSFSSSSYFYPTTTSIEYLQNHANGYRVMATDSRILPPNVSAFYHIATVDGYDPLYLLSYGQLIAASEREKADITPPFGFNRILTPHTQTKVLALLGVKYILSFDELHDPNLIQVLVDGKTRVYESKQALPKAFFVTSLQQTASDQETITAMFDSKNDLSKTAFIQHDVQTIGCQNCDVTVTSYQENRVRITTKNDTDGFLVLNDAYYPTWTASIDGNQTTLIRTDLALRGIYVPKGEHTIQFTIQLL